MTMNNNGQELIDLARYPIDQPGSAPYTAMLEQVRADLAKDGCAVIRGFLTETGVAAAVAEADSVAHLGHRSYSRTNVYFSQEDTSLAADHPARQFYDRSNAFIPADNFTAQGPLRQVHDHPGFDGFIRDCLGEPSDAFFRYDDPLADMIVNTAEEGNGFPWHFDTNNFTVTLALQNAEEGGEFEYAPMIRHKSAPDGGENFAEVSDVLNEVSDRVVSLTLQPGDLQLFRGRNSLHRVAPLRGKRARHVAIMSYVEREGMCGSPERTRQLYGRVLPVHLERAGLRADDWLD
ncbi:MAG: HalD/BesD family halogenase [Halocynthiibacter sp.]